MKPERVNQVVAYIPEACTKCRQPLPRTAGAKDLETKRHQVVELVPMPAIVTEHQAHGRTCPCYG